MDLDHMQKRFDLVCATIERQKAYIARVPDPDNRYVAEGNLLTLVGMRDDLEAILAPDILMRDHS